MYVPLVARANIRNVRRLLRGAPGTLQETAFDEEILCPEEISSAIPAAFLPGQLDRITGTQIETSVPLELELLVRNTAVHAATIAYHIRNAVLYEGAIYAGALKYPICSPPSFPTQSEDREFGTVGLTSAWLGSQYFGHWLKDDCLRYLLAEAFGKPLSVMRAPLSNHMAEYAGYFGQDWTTTSRARIDHLVIYQDFSQNSFKKQRYAALQARLAANLPAGPASLVYLRRGNSGEIRTIENEDGIIASLSNRGFSVVDLTSDRLADIAGPLMNARLVVSLEGSHLSHCWFPPNGKGGILTLQPPDRFTAIHRSYTECMSAKYGIVVGTKRGPATTYFEPNEILRTVDLMLKECA